MVLDLEPVSHPTATGALCVLCGRGDIRLEWDQNDPASVERARAEWAALIGKGFAAFRMEGDGSAGEQVKEFDPTAREVIFVPPVAGG